VIINHESFRHTIDRIVQQRLSLHSAVPGFYKLRLGCNLGRDVASDPPIADESAGPIVHRHAADSDMADCSVCADPVVTEVEESSMAFYVPLMLLPPLWLLTGVVELPSPFADIRLVTRGAQWRTNAYSDKAELRVLLPEPVGRELGEVTQTGFACPHRRDFVPSIRAENAGKEYHQADAEGEHGRRRDQHFGLNAGQFIEGAQSAGAAVACSRKDLGFDGVKPGIDLVAFDLVRANGVADVNRGEHGFNGGQIPAVDGKQIGEEAAVSSKAASPIGKCDHRSGGRGVFRTDLLAGLQPIFSVE
jgi:hypothetical protein